MKKLFLARVEIPQGSKVKYEIKKDGVMVDRLLDREYPFNYGYLEGTLAKDGDALDVFILNPVPIQPNSLADVKTIGLIKMLDNGVEDHKILALVHGTAIHPDFNRDILAQLRAFLESYKTGVCVLEAYILDKDDTAREHEIDALISDSKFEYVNQHFRSSF